MPISTIGTNSLASSPTLTTPKVTTTIGVGNATPSASGAGITFPATQSASTDANTLDDYEEGTWTPTDGSGAGLTFTSITATYTKIGRLVTLNCQFTFPTTANASIIQITGMPFAPTAGNATGALSTSNASATVYVVTIASALAILYLRNTANNNPTNANFSAAFLSFSITYPAS